MGSSSSRPQQIITYLPPQPRSKRSITFTVFLMLIMAAIFCVTAVTVYYIEETKDTVTNPRITPDIIRICEAAQALSMGASLIMLIYLMVVLFMKRS